MEQRNPFLPRTLLLGATSALCVLAACSDSKSDPGASQAALVAECTNTESMQTLPADAWVCPEARTVECTGGNGTADVDKLYVRDNDDASCDGDIVLSKDGPFAVGEHTIRVRGEEGEELCKAQLTVVDTQPPTVEAHTMYLWPPNHKFHSIAVSDCVSAVDACNGELQGEFIWASSDEPVDDRGDGHHAPDIQIDDCGHVSVRAERAGPKDGRVYKLGVRIVDAAGHAVESECSIIVDHDQRGVDGADSGESYRIVLDGTNDAPACDGVTEIAPPPSDADNPGDDDDAPPGDNTPPDGDDDAGVPENPDVL